MVVPFRFYIGLPRGASSPHCVHALLYMDVADDLLCNAIDVSISLMSHKVFFSLFFFFLRVYTFPHLCSRSLPPLGHRIRSGSRTSHKSRSSSQQPVRGVDCSCLALAFFVSLPHHPPVTAAEFTRLRCLCLLGVQRESLIVRTEGKGVGGIAFCSIDLFF